MQKTATFSVIRRRILHPLGYGGDPTFWPRYHGWQDLQYTLRKVEEEYGIHFPVQVRISSF
jgi:hypothetical protein